MSHPTPPTPLPPFTAALCGRELAPAEREALERALAGPPPSDAALLRQLIEELAATAPKPAVIGLKRLPGALAALGPAHAIAWLDLGVSLAAQSSTAAQKYFLESPDRLAAVPPARRPNLFALAQELCDDHYLVVMEFLRAAPELPEGIDPDLLGLWMQTGLRLAEQDRVLAVEYFRISPQVLALVSAEDLPLWVELGVSLVEPNALGKLDYLKVIEYFRLSTGTLSAVEPSDLRKPFLALGRTLARRSPAWGMDYLRAAPAAIAGFDTPPQRRLFLSKAAEIGAREPSLVMDFLKEGPRMFRALERSETDFAAWVETGIGLMDRQPERARAYFSGRSRTGQDTTERLIGGTTLGAVGRVLTLFAEGLSGRPVAVKANSELPEEMREAVGDAPTTDGRTIYLPARIRLFPDERDNFRVYKVATLHEAGHLQFGTYTPRMELLAEAIAGVRGAYPNAAADGGEVRTLGEFLRLFPDPDWARFLWTVLEDARVDARLRAEYPGACADMDRLIAFELQSRPALENLPPREAVREALTQLSMTDTTEAPLSLAEAVSEAYRIMQQLKQPGAAPEDSLRALAGLYPYLEEQLRKFPDVEGESDPLRAREKQLSRDSSSSEGGGGKSLSPAQPSFRGTMHPEWVERQAGDKTVPINPAGGTPPGPDAGRRESSSLNRMSGRHDAATGEGSSAPPPAGEGVTRTDADGPDGKVFFYDEWDEAAREYRPKWCRLFEHRVPESGGGASRIVEETIAAYRPIIRRLRRHFQAMRPESYRKVKRQAMGEEFDLDAVVESRAELRVGRTPMDRLYIKSEKRLRDVAAAFLIDMSGSTSRHIAAAGRRVIEIEQEALILMAEALQAVGDRFAIYGFSGDSRERVDFYVFKDFADGFHPGVRERIASMRSLNQNRDGAAIRHASARLAQQAAKTRLLILLSDGKPLDADYAGAYSLQDTKAALREARMRRIHPYCITIDPQTRETGRYVAEMYGEIGHTVIDQVATLPDKLPRIYRRLTT